MCRINGIFEKNINTDILLKMRDTLSYGGPDDAGLYADIEAGIGLGHRRLAVLDLTSGGHQPMVYNEWIIVFNGEIYNFKEIANELKEKGYHFSSESDTEVILKAFECWSYDCVQKFRGMFAFALWNKNTQKLLLCRDRVGIKPLYWYSKDGLFMFASELKAFREHPSFDKTINQDAVSLFLQTGYIRSPYSIYKYAHKVEPGSFLEIDSGFNISTWKYWSIRDKYLKSKLNKKTENDLISECENILTESFNLRMVADVPVGMFLSGGIDSSLVTALLQKDAITPLKTFTIGFEDKRFNEAQHAKTIAKHLGTNHTELYCTNKHFEEIINYLPDFYDEPFGDSSAIPTYLVSKLAREKVTVSLSADGGDEIFTGYNRYLFAESLHNKFASLPMAIKNFAGKIVENTNVNFAQNVISILPVPQYYKKNIDARLPKLVEVFKAKNHLDFLYASTLFITKNSLVKIHIHDSTVSIFNTDFKILDNQRYGAYCVADIESYLEGDILTKVDRATMQVALEGREPFLDHKIIEFALSLPDNMKIRDGQTKWILRQILYKYVPKELLERPKMGFGIPLDDWLSLYFKDELLSILENGDFINLFNFNKIELNKLLNNYFLGNKHSPYLIWYIFCLYKWFMKWK